MSIERMQELTKSIDALTQERREVGQSLPPVCVDALKSDHAFMANVRRWTEANFPTIDTTILDHDTDKWELLTPRYEVLAHEEGWAVWDNVEGVFVTDEDDGCAIVHADEGDADDDCREREQEWAESRYAFPFAWNYGWEVGTLAWLDDFAACGFIAYRYDDYIVIAGIDGAGYSFMDAHFAPLFARLAERHGWLVDTVAGPRRVTVTKENA
jgi:hypothetical protein